VGRALIIKNVIVNIKKTFALLSLICLSGCSYNGPSDYEFSEVICIDNNGNKIIRCFSHINAFVDREDYYYALKQDNNLKYYKLESVDEHKLYLVKRSQKFK